jgi:hypothetical protein
LILSRNTGVSRLPMSLFWPYSSYGTHIWSWLFDLLSLQECLKFGITIIAAFAFNHFIRRRISFSMHLNASHSLLTTSRYLYLIAMSAFEIIISFTSYTMVHSKCCLWINWYLVHSNLSQIDIYPVAFTTSCGGCYRRRSSFTFVAFFASGQDAVVTFSL